MSAEVQESGGKNGKSKQKKFAVRVDFTPRSEEHTSELQSQPRISYAVFCLLFPFFPPLSCTSALIVFPPF